MSDAKQSISDGPIFLIVFTEFTDDEMPTKQILTELFQSVDDG